MQEYDVQRLALRIFRLELWICRCKRKDQKVQKSYDELLGAVAKTLKHCQDAGLISAAEQIEIVLATLRVDVSRDNFEAISLQLRNVYRQLLIATGHHQFFRLEPEDTHYYTAPLVIFGDAADKFPSAKHSMTHACQCFALDEWDAAVFHSMGVLEQGLRWLADQINAGPFPLTLTKPIEFECWENIIGNIKARIDEELGPQPPGSLPRPKKTPQREEELSFYAKVALEFRYFKDAWRNHVAHDRHDPYEKPEARLVLDHVASFMKTLAVRV